MSVLCQSLSVLKRRKSLTISAPVSLTVFIAFFLGFLFLAHRKFFRFFFGRTKIIFYLCKVVWINGQMKNYETKHTNN